MLPFCAVVRMNPNRAIRPTPFYDFRILNALLSESLFYIDDTMSDQF